MIASYLAKQAFLKQQIFTEAPVDLAMVIVIPARNEPTLLHTLQAILAADKPKRPFELIIVFNHPENVEEALKKANLLSMEECQNWIDRGHLDFIHLIKAFDLPTKHAGVGLARKIGMDEALRRFGDDREGLIVALDADCSVAQNYLQRIEAFFEEKPKYNAASIYFEHPLDDLHPELNKAIIQYELHLRYYNQLLRFAGHPFAFHTIGSSMVVKTSAYVKQGGMNKRKAGEDFYFLQKIIQLGDYGEINDTCVYPSARVSDRVPFGTGRAMAGWLEEKKDVLLTYHPQVAMVLREFFDLLRLREEMPDFEDLTPSIRSFIGKEEWQRKSKELTQNTRSKEAFIQRFFSWFNLFMCFKFVHFYRDHYQANIAVREAAKILAPELEIEVGKQADALALLKVFREWERSGSF